MISFIAVLNSPRRIIAVVRSGAVGATSFADEEDGRDESAEDARAGHQTAPEEHRGRAGRARVAKLDVVLSHLEHHEEADRRSDQHR